MSVDRPRPTGCPPDRLKDHRPDLKQLVFGMCIHGSCGVPLTMGLHDGNTSDSVANRGHLSKLGALLPAPDDVTVVADCKLVDGETLGLLTGSGFHFVSLVPKTFNVRGELIDEVWSHAPDVADWPILATKPGAKKADPMRHYRGMSRTGAFNVAFPAPSPDESPVESLELFRCLVVHSEDLEARFDSSIDGKLEREAAKLQKTHKRLLAEEYACAADAEQAVGPLVRKLKWHVASVTVEERQVVEKRSKRGRPRKDAPPPETRTVYVPQVHLVRDNEVIARARRHASCFVLVTDWSTEEWYDERVLSEYRYQSLIEGHTGFRWLKGPAAVAPVFLDTPSRIRALGFIFMVALMVRNYIQFTLRAAMKDRGQGILHPFRKRPDDNLTTEMALVWFEGVIATSLRQPGGPWVRQLPKLPEPALEVLELLDISAEVFRVPPRRTENGRAGP
jgi:transposase